MSASSFHLPGSPANHPPNPADDVKQALKVQFRILADMYIEALAILDGEPDHPRIAWTTLGIIGRSQHTLAELLLLLILPEDADDFYRGDATMLAETDHPAPVGALFPQQPYEGGGK